MQSDGFPRSHNTNFHTLFIRSAVCVLFTHSLSFSMPSGRFSGPCSTYRKVTIAAIHPLRLLVGKIEIVIGRCGRLHFPRRLRWVNVEKICVLGVPVCAFVDEWAKKIFVCVHYNIFSQKLRVKPYAICQIKMFWNDVRKNCFWTFVLRWRLNDTFFFVRNKIKFSITFQFTTRISIRNISFKRSSEMEQLSVRSSEKKNRKHNTLLLWQDKKTYVSHRRYKSRVRVDKIHIWFRPFTFVALKTHFRRAFRNFRE